MGMLLPRGTRQCSEQPLGRLEPVPVQGISQSRSPALSGPFCACLVTFLLTRSLMKPQSTADKFNGVERCT